MHAYTCEGTSYAVFSFRDQADADRFMQAFDGEEFDPRDIGGGSKWMFWFRGRVSKRKKKPYDFRP